MGLGNPGPHHARSRHNVGFGIVRAFAERHRFPAMEARFQAAYAVGCPFGRTTAALLPQTFMNRSGAAVSEALASLPDVDPASGLIVVFDDLDLPFGRIRLRARGSAGGQRGVQSVIEALGGDAFARLRFGIGRPPEGQTVRDHVLAPFDVVEDEALARHVDRAVDAIDSALERGLAVAMDRFNRPDPVIESD